MKNKSQYTISENSEIKILKSENYNYIFNKKNGFFAHWGKTKDEDPEFNPFANEILDIEISTICNGVPNTKGIESPCSFCYKSNTKTGVNMSLETFKKIFDNQSKILTQIAFGADANATSNPELFQMMQYCRDNEVIPNITVANITDETADKLASLCGAVAVSRYENKNVCYDSIKKLTDRGMTQCNMHIMVSDFTYDQVMETLQDAKTDPRLEKLNAIVMLSLKQVGRGIKFDTLEEDRYKKLVNYALENNISIGFDSCSAFKFLKSVQDHKDIEKFKTCVNSCESFLQSAYINVHGIVSACSFTTNSSFKLDAVNNKIEDLWHSDEAVKWRNRLLDTSKGNCLGCCECPVYKI